MQKSPAVLVLLLAAVLEAGGDALVRSGMRAPAPLSRLVLWLAAAAILFLYGWTVNVPGWDFGRLLGLYVVFFFLIAQILSAVVFKQGPSPGLLLGGALIVSGGFVIALVK